MSYIESVIDSAANRTPAAPARREVLEHALSLRYSDEMKDAAQQASRTLEVGKLTNEDQALFQSRIFGGMATKLALASHNSDQPTLYQLAPADQQRELEIVANNYADTAAKLIDVGSETTHTLLSSYNMATELAPLPNKLVRSWVYAARRAQINPIQHLKNIGSYINVVPGSFPPSPYFIDSMGNNDATLVQAFGRDSITDDELVLIRDERQKINSDDEMMAYLESIDFKPGPSNIALADKVAYLFASGNPMEQVIQWEVTYAFYQKHPSLYSRYRSYIHTVWPHSGFYPTYEVKEDSVAVMDKVGLYNPIELAHGDMMSRAVGILTKLGVQPDPLAADIPFDTDSTQPHVRNERSFMVREALARVEHVLRGRVTF